jgi:hypothetical protein
MPGWKCGLSVKKLQSCQDARRRNPASRVTCERAWALIACGSPESRRALGRTSRPANRTQKTEICEVVAINKPHRANNGQHAYNHRSKPTQSARPHWVISRHCQRSSECPLHPRKRTSNKTVAMSAQCQKPTSSISIENLIGLRNQRGGYLQAEQLSRLQIDC